MAKAKQGEMIEITERTRTVPIPDTLQSVPNFPAKLKIYKIAASPYWQVRCYEGGRTVKRSTGATHKLEAYKFAKELYEQLIYNKHSGTALTKQSRFDVCANGMMNMQSGRVARKEITAQSHQNDRYLLDSKVLPFFREHDIGEVNYALLDEFLLKLSEAKLSASSIQRYMGLVRKTLDYAHNRAIINAIPKFPKIKKQDSARGWFTTAEYRKLYSRAYALAGKEYQMRGITKKGKETDNAIRKLHFTNELAYLIVFMSNSFIRPTDIKNMQHKHVQVINKSDRMYLRLTLPSSKKHDKPIATMSQAVRTYEQLKAMHAANDMANAEDYVFMPQFKNRDTALRRLQQQFNYVLDVLQLKKGARNESRSLYSLRHTCIMYRLLYGDGIDLLTLARNARTSVEMIERFYASELTGEMNIEALQSRRRHRINPKHAMNVAD
jgi:hypothetical protein